MNFGFFFDGLGRAIKHQLFANMMHRNRIGFVANSLVNGFARIAVIARHLHFNQLVRA